MWSPTPIYPPASRDTPPRIAADVQETGTYSAEIAADIHATAARREEIAADNRAIGTDMNAIAGCIQETRISFMETTPDWS